MREIKFRGWSLYDEKWVYGYLTVKTTKRDLEKHYYIYSESGISGWRVDPESVGQLILAFKDGTEFYEGDIVFCIDEDEGAKAYHTLEWQGGGYPAYDLSGDHGKDINGINYYLDYGDIIVTGNRFENNRDLK